ncbi:MAG: hypothetical protein RMJ17_03090 [Candidatus Aenigmarchaeota archaeon]|nr:hypothetical protein [Candidatus Aenigmarchaeota archaeon]MDW8149552.1 hypothetical protein [Candidatus Aenigmarchaeota archaeon]
MKYDFHGLKTQAMPTEEKFALELFVEFLKNLPKFYQGNRVISFKFLKAFFSWHGLNKNDSKEIVKLWVKYKFCVVKPFHGIKLNSTFLNTISFESKVEVCELKNEKTGDVNER